LSATFVTSGPSYRLQAANINPPPSRIETEVRRILDFCGLEFEAGCVDFHKTQHAVHSASSEQVRRPINRDCVDQWRRYEPWLGNLKAALGSLVS
jgi:hypothetical protein